MERLFISLGTNVIINIGILYAASGTILTVGSRVGRIRFCFNHFDTLYRMTSYDIMQIR